MFVSDEVNTLIKRKLQEQGLTKTQIFRISSSKDPNVQYIVKEDNGNWECDCPLFTYTGGKE